MFFKNDLDLLLEILDMVKGSLELLDLSENDLRANESNSEVINRRRHFGLINGLIKMYYREGNDMFKKAWPLSELNLMSSSLVHDPQDAEIELENLKYVLTLKKQFDSKMEIKIVKDEPFCY